MSNKDTVLKALSDQTLSRGALVVFLFLQLYRKPWTEGQYKLADKVGLSRLSVLEALKTLEGQDYIVKRQNPERRNHQIVELKETKNG